MRSRVVLVAGLTVLIVGLAVVGAGVLLRHASTTATFAGGTGSPDRTGAATPSPTPSCSAWGCVQDARFATITAYLKNITNGHVGIEVRDRVTGAVWVGGEPDFQVWAGSTPKLALAVALLEEDRAGQIHLDANAHAEITAMLHVSDNDAANTLWGTYVGSGYNAMMKRWNTVYGMTTAHYLSGYCFDHHWGFVKATPKDLAGLMSYVLDKLDVLDRDYIVNQMQNVGDIQHWGVWGAGPANQPGVKDGWSRERETCPGVLHQINATVGFAGPDRRYIVAAMYHQNPGGDTDAKGVQVLTDLTALVFGLPVPAPAVVPPELTNA
jgi:hypothetical protein